MPIDEPPATENLAAVAIIDEAHSERTPRETSDAYTLANCANCETVLHGAYCHACGQSAHIHRSLLHMIEEFLHGLFHFETKAWRTLPALFFRPGFLTRDYIAGKRIRYVSPLALFLFSAFLMFLVFSYTISDAPSNLEVKQAVSAAQEKPLSTVSPQSATTASPFKASDLPEHPRFAALLDAMINDTQFTIYKMKKNAASLAFLLIPLSLPFVWLLFAFRAHYRHQFLLFDHAVFVIYSLSFMTWLMILVALLAKLSLSTLAMILFFIAPPLHIYTQLKHAYQLSTASTAWRTLALLCVALLTLTLYVAMITFMST